MAVQRRRRHCGGGALAGERKAGGRRAADDGQVWRAPARVRTRCTIACSGVVRDASKDAVAVVRSALRNAVHRVDVVRAERGARPFFYSLFQRSRCVHDSMKPSRCACIVGGVVENCQWGNAHARVHRHRRLRSLVHWCRCRFRVLNVTMIMYVRSVSI
jgi:hypothetical protein